MTLKSEHDAVGFELINIYTASKVKRRLNIFLCFVITDVMSYTKMNIVFVSSLRLIYYLFISSKTFLCPIGRKHI